MAKVDYHTYFGTRTSRGTDGISNYGYQIYDCDWSCTPETYGRWDNKRNLCAQAIDEHGDVEAVLADCDVVFTCVGNDDDLRSVVLGENGVFAGMKPNAILFDCTTDSAMVARELAAVANEKGLRFIDGPVSGGQAGAENGVLTVMCGAAEADFAEAREVAMAFAAAVTRIGEVGCGQLAKMCNQICIAGIVEALSEAIAFGENAGLDMPLVLDVISKGAAQSWQMENRGKTMVKREFDFGFAVDWMRKDLGLCLAEAKKNGSSLPLVEMVDQFYGEVQNLGGRRYDTSSLVMRLPSKK